MDWWIKVGNVVQFTENHKWCGCFGVIDEIKECGDDVRYMIGVPQCNGGIAYIFSMASDKDFEFIADEAVLWTRNGENDDRND